MNTRELNKKLKTNLLRPGNIKTNSRFTTNPRNVSLRVDRARSKKYGTHEWTEADITIYAEVQTTTGEWLPLHRFGARAIRNFIRRSSVSNSVCEWTRLWGFPTGDLKLTTIKLSPTPTLYNM